jgi:hypothetical protein
VKNRLKVNEDYYKYNLFKSLDLATAFDSYFSTLW